MIIGKGIQHYWKPKAIESIESPPNSRGLPAEEYDQIIATVIKSNEIKDNSLVITTIFTQPKWK